MFALSLKATRALSSGLREFSTASHISRASLSNLLPTTANLKHKKRVGRGIGSGRGKTCGRGMKGQHARRGNHGLKGKGFEGGQTPFHLRMPKTGFHSLQQKNGEECKVLNLDKLLQSIKTGKLVEHHDQYLSQDGLIKIDLRTIFVSNLVGKIPYGVKLLSGGEEEFRKSGLKVDIEVTKASQKVIDAIESNGGRIVTKYYSPLALRAQLYPHRFDVLPEKQPRPPFKKIKYWLNNENRGYLSPEVQVQKLLAKE